MSTYSQLGYQSYHAYLASNHFKRLKRAHIKTNSRSKCWICGKKSTLLLHHVNYHSLGAEVLNRDIFILCWNCHSKVHFSLFGFYKIPLTTRSLRRRMFFLKCRSSILKLNPIQGLWYFIRWISQ